MAGVKSLDFEDRPCNCNRDTKIQGECIFNGECRKSIIIYEAKCNQCGMVYIGNTQQTFKDRMNQHFADVTNLVNKNQSSDSFAAHMAGHIHQNFKGEATNGLARAMVKLRILWQGDPISCMKTFGTNKCTLCMKERTSILNQSRKDHKMMVNSRSEIYGACRHRRSPTLN